MILILLRLLSNFTNYRRTRKILPAFEAITPGFEAITPPFEAITLALIYDVTSALDFVLVPAVDGTLPRAVKSKQLLLTSMALYWLLCLMQLEYRCRTARDA